MQEAIPLNMQRCLITTMVAAECELANTKCQLSAIQNERNF